MSDLTDNLADGPLASENYSFVNALAVSESASVSDTWSFVILPGGLLNDVATASDAVALTLSRNASLSQGVVARDSFSLATPASASTSATASETWAATATTRVIERATARDQWLPSATHGVSLAQGVKATDSFDIKAAKSASSSATASDQIDITYIAGVQITDHVVVMDAVGEGRQVLVYLSDSARASGDVQPNFVYNVRMVDLVAAFDEMEMSGTDTTWAINTRTNAVTQYANWNFNSFAEMGRKFIAARSDGLYELNGARDEPNVNVVGTIGSGFTQMNGGKQAGLKGVYLGVRGQGVWQLKLLAGDGREWVYRRLSNPGLMTTKFDIGKGLHVRYLAWELSAYEGQDFDLDTVELVPMMSGRRIG